jgi:acetyltransferase-like isoleucine patch superfamily enzyme
MFLDFLLFLNRKKPIWKGHFFTFLYSSSRVKIGKNFQCNTFPALIVDRNCSIEIGNNVLFRRNVELRSHNNSKIKIGNNIRVDRGVRILSANNANILIQDGVRIGLYSVLNGGDSIYIGEKTLISGFVYLQTSMHKFQNDKNIQEQGFFHLPVRLENDVWLGTHSVILPGCIIGKGAIVGSNAVVTKSVKEGNIVGGVPASVIKSR